MQSKNIGDGEEAEIMRSICVWCLVEKVEEEIMNSGSLCDGMMVIENVKTNVQFKLEKKEQGMEQDNVKVQDFEDEEKVVEGVTVEEKLEEKEKSVKPEVIEEVELSEICVANKGDILEEFEVVEDVNQEWDVVDNQEEGSCGDIK